MKYDQLDLVEINEAFAAQSLAVAQAMTQDGHGWDWDKTNVNGGAIALGHPVGASGARIVVTLLHEMKRRDSRYGAGHAVRRRRAGRGDGRGADLANHETKTRFSRSFVSAFVTGPCTRSALHLQGGSMYIFKAGVVGAGTMGGEIAQVISFSGLPVVLKDVDQNDARQGHGDHPAHLPEPGGQGQDERRRDGEQDRPRSSRPSPTTASATWTSSSKPCPRRWRSRRQVLSELDTVLPGDDHLRQQHLGALDQRDGARPRSGRARSSACTSSTRPTS